jgi:hypothetical protein
MFSKWKGKERRKQMNQDQIERDRLLTEVHSDVRHIVDWSKKHDDQDTIRFDSMDKRLKWAEKIGYGFIGVIVFIEFLSKILN